MKKSRIDRLPVALELCVIPLGVALLQFHGIPFWGRVFSLHTGMPFLDWAPAILASLTLEIANIWLWTFARRFILGTITALLLILGPLVETGEPLWRQFQVEQSSEAALEAAQGRVEFYRSLAEKRAGWQEDLRRAEEATQTAQLDERQAMPFLSIVRSLMLLAALVLFAALVPLALHSIGSRIIARRKSLLERIQEKLRFGAPDWISKELREALLSHEDRRLAGKKVLSAADMRRVANRLQLA